MVNRLVNPVRTARCRAASLACAFLLASACATQAPRPAVNPAQFLHDEAFPASAGYPVESSRDVFQLDDSARRYLDLRIGRVRETNARNKALIEEIIQQSARKLSYDSDADTTASETFHNQSANCLSMSIMTYAIAKYLRYDAVFQDVDTPEYWDRRDGHRLVARHVNVLLKPERSPDLLRFGSVIEVDFFAPGSSREFPTKLIPPSRVLAMFYNNKGVDALFAGNHDVAYAYLRAALLEDPSLGMAIGNLGALYRATNHLPWAEKAYRAAVRMNAGSTVPLEGLARVLQDTGRHAEAERMLAELDSRRMNNPYYRYMQGEEAYDARRWNMAIRHFRKAIALKPRLDAAYFGLAKTFFQLGENGKAEAYLERAARYAARDSERQRYQRKIDALTGGS